MHNEQSGARTHHRRDGEVLSAADAASLVRGRDLKRCVRAAAAFNGLYDDKAIAEAVGVGRGAVAGWWKGAQAEPEKLQRLADVTGLSFAELTEYVYLSGPLPQLPSGPAGLLEGVRRAQESPADEAPDTPVRSPGPPPPGGGEERG
jgi:transcriptional regulator with XRE-family HTH domain